MVNTNENWAIKEKDLRIIDFFYNILSISRKQNNINLKFVFFKRRSTQTIYYLLNHFGKIKNANLNLV